LTSGSKARRSFMHLIWFSCAWKIWKERNNMIFNNTNVLLFNCWTRLSCFSFCG